MFEPVVVGQCMGPGQVEPLTSQHREKGFGPGQCGHGFNGRFLEVFKRAGLAMPIDGVAGKRPARHMRVGSGLTIGVEQQVHRPWPGFAQRSGGQQPAIACATFIHDADFQIPLQCQVLQAVIAHEQLDLGVAVSKLSGGLQPRGTDPDGDPRAAANQQRFVTSLCGIAVWQDFTDLSALAPVSARDHSWLQAQALQVLHQGNRRRRFACPASDHIAHDNDGNAWMSAWPPAQPIAQSADPNQSAIQPRQRPQELGGQAALQPDLRQKDVEWGHVAGGWAEKNRLQRKGGDLFAGIIVDGPGASLGCFCCGQPLWITL